MIVFFYFQSVANVKLIANAASETDYRQNGFFGNTQWGLLIVLSSVNQLASIPRYFLT